MLRPRARIIVLIILILLVPWLFYALWLADYTNKPTYDPPPPQQIISRTDLSYQNCDQAVTAVTDPPAQPVEEPGQAVVNSEEAKGVADTALRRALDLPEGRDPEYVYGPALLRATLPGGDEKLVYARLWSVAPYFSDQDTSIIFLDAASGEPLILYTGLTALDPAFGGGCALYSLDTMELVTPQFMLVSTLAFDAVLIVLIGLAALAVSVIRSLRHRNQPSEPQPPIS